MVNKDFIKIGDIVYLQEFWTGAIFSGEICQILDDGVRVIKYRYLVKNINLENYFRFYLK